MRRDGSGEKRPALVRAILTDPSTVPHAFLLQLENGEPADPAVSVDADLRSWMLGDSFVPRTEPLAHRVRGRWPGSARR
jgi:hypothetical protein